jgi:hypothetical protein
MTNKLTAAKQNEQDLRNKHVSDFAELGRTVTELNDALEHHAQTVAALRQNEQVMRDEYDDAVDHAIFFSQISDFETY